jgi:hypothetical protein
LNGILAAVMLEHGISQQTLPKDTRIGRLVTFMKDYGTVKMDGDRITGYLKRLDEAMKHFNASLSNFLLSTSAYSPVDVDWSPYRYRSGLCQPNGATDRSEAFDDESRFVSASFHSLIGLV